MHTYYGDSYVLQGIDVAVPRGQIVAVLGRNGMGKSTLFLTIMGFTRLTRELAYGQQRLLEISLALAARPKVLLLDEPAAGVPRNESAALFKAIAGLPEDITVFFIEHDMDIVFTFASRIIVLVGGRVLVEGTPAEIAADQRVREVYLGHGKHG